MNARGLTALHRAGLAALLAAAALAGCGQPADPPPTAGVPVEADMQPFRPARAPADPYTVPEAIDVAYLHGVFEALDVVDGDMFRLVVDAGRITPEAYELMTAVYTDEAWHNQIRILEDFLANDRDRVKPAPGNRVTVVTRILRADAHCVLVEAVRDFSAVADVAPHETEPDFIALSTKVPGDDPAAHNPTPWQIAWDRLEQEGNPCDSAS